MTKKKAIIRFSMIGILVILGVLLTFVSFQLPFINNGTTTWVSTLGAVQSRLGIDLQGGVLAVFDVSPNPEYSEGRTTVTPNEINATIRRLENALSSRGFVEARVMSQGSSQIRVEVPGIQDSDELMQVMGEPADLEFRRSDGTPFMTGRGVTHVTTFQAQNYEWGIRLHFTGEGRDLFRDAINAEGVGGSIQIVANNQVISQPTIQSTDVGAQGYADITSSDWRTQAPAENMRTQIESGLFEVRLSISETSTIPPTLGEGALLAGIIAFGVGLLFIFIFMYLLYGHLGLLSNLSMVIFTILFLFALAVVGSVQLTLPGVAGIILSMAMAVDANIIIFERIKDEYKAGKRMPVAVESGFKKSFWTIFDANITTIIAAAVLYFLGTGPIQGFAITLLLGVAISMFCSLFILKSLARQYLHINSTNAKVCRLKQERTLTGEIEQTAPTTQAIKKARSLNFGNKENHGRS